MQRLRGCGTSGSFEVITDRFEVKSDAIHRFIKELLPRHRHCGRVVHKQDLGRFQMEARQTGRVFECWWGHQVQRSGCGGKKGQQRCKLGVFRELVSVDKISTARSIHVKPSKREFSACVLSQFHIPLCQHRSIWTYNVCIVSEMALGQNEIENSLHLQVRDARKIIVTHSPAREQTKCQGRVIADATLRDLRHDVCTGGRMHAP